MLNRALRRVLSLIAVLAAATLGLVDAAAAQSIEDVGDEVDQTGRFVEKSVDAELEGAIERANAADIGFVWLDQGGGDAEQVATTLAAYLLEIDSDYRSIVVLNNDSVWVTSRGDNGTEAGQNARELFAIGDEVGGLDLVTDTITGAIDGDVSSGDNSAGNSSSGNAAADDSGTASTNTSSGSSGGFPWILLIVLGLVAFFGFRFMSGRRRSRKQLEANMEADRLEIREQLKNNADRVIDLGDRVIAAGDPEMIRTYEKASATYQDVSQSIDARVDRRGSRPARRPDRRSRVAVRGDRGDPRRPSGPSVAVRSRTTASSPVGRRSRGATVPGAANRHPARAHRSSIGRPRRGPHDARHDRRNAPSAAPAAAGSAACWPVGWGEC